VTRPSPWPDLEGDWESVDDNVGPFPLSPFLEAWWEALGNGEPLTVRSTQALLPLTSHGSEIRIAGESDLTDYHSPLGSGIGDLAGPLADLARSGHRLTLDSLPQRSSFELMTGLEEEGLEVGRVEHEVAAVLELTSEIDHLAALSKQQRHEVRRKRRRYTHRLGPVEIRVSRSDSEAFDRFVRTHRSAPGRKGRFLTGQRETFFRLLAGQPGWRIDELSSEDRTIASLFGFEDQDTYYLYNSAYDPEFRDASPGMVLLAETIDRVGRAGLTRFDFLKGGEDYKFRLGARRRQLYRIETA